MAVTPSAVGIGALVFVIGAFLEHRLGLFSRLMVLWHTLINSEVMAQVEETYDLDMPFENVREELKSVLLEGYEDVDIETNTDTTLTANIGDHFTVTMEADEDTATVTTTKIVSTMRGVNRDLTRLFDALDEMQERSRAVAKSSKTLTEDGVTVDLYLPHRSKYLDFHLPFGAWLTEYTFTLEHAKYDWHVEQTDGHTAIHATTRDDAKRLISSALGPFLTF